MSSFVCQVVAFLVALLVTVCVMRLSVCLPAYRQRRKRKVQSQVRTMIIFGSGLFYNSSDMGFSIRRCEIVCICSSIGGHTTEMIMLLEKMQLKNFGPLQCIIAQVRRKHN